MRSSRRGLAVQPVGELAHRSKQSVGLRKPADRRGVGGAEVLGNSLRSPHPSSFCVVSLGSTPGERSRSTVERVTTSEGAVPCRDAASEQRIIEPSGEGRLRRTPAVAPGDAPSRFGESLSSRWRCRWADLVARRWLAGARLCLSLAAGPLAGSFSLPGARRTRFLLAVTTAR